MFAKWAAWPASCMSVVSAVLPLPTALGSANEVKFAALGTWKRSTGQTASQAEWPPVQWLRSALCGPMESVSSCEFARLLKSNTHGRSGIVPTARMVAATPAAANGRSRSSTCLQCATSASLQQSVPTYLARSTARNYLSGRAGPASSSHLGSRSPVLRNSAPRPKAGLE